ncbi:MAG: hypothetical protein ACYTBJ_21205 [Planctomycetota bacterium]|jgi:hypothetical protein
MNSPEHENLKELFEKFLNSQQAETGAEDIERGERILRENPAPAPREELVAGIKAEVGRALSQEKANPLSGGIWKAACVAAAFVIVAVVSTKISERNGNGPPELITASIIPSAIWDSDDIAADDADLATLNAEMEQIKSEALALRLGESDSNNVEDLTELEEILVEIDSDFWKG